MEELLVVSCVDSGDMVGEACRELEVVTDEALMGADGGIELMEGTKLVCTLFGFGRIVDESSVF